MRGWALTSAVLGALIGQIATARADDVPTTLPAQPVPKAWEVGVSQADRDRVNVLFSEGGALFKSDDPRAVMAKYEEAVAIWDHPVIRMNMAVLYIRQERYLDAAESIDHALRWRAEPFTPQQYSMLLDYKKLVGANVGTIEATCAKGNAELVLDGKPWFTCPGVHTQRVLTGQHVVLATQRGYSDSRHPVLVVAETPSHVNIRPLTDDEAFEDHRRFPRWLPLTVMGVGAAGLVSGIALLISAGDKMNEYDQIIATNCAVNGCNMQALEQWADLKDTAIFRDKAGRVVTVLGGATLIGGFVMLLVNRPTRRLRLDLAPTSGGATASAQWSF